MLWVVTAMLTIITGISLAITAIPEIARKISGFFLTNSRIYLAGLIRIALGIMLLFLAAESRWWIYVFIFGIATTGFGIAIFFVPLRRIKELLTRMQNKPDFFTRGIFSITAVILALLLYALFPEIPR